jgi:hypothetical protein
MELFSASSSSPRPYLGLLLPLLHDNEVAAELKSVDHENNVSITAPTYCVHTW